MICQIPIGWLSDRMDRRVVIAGLTLFGALAGLLGLLVTGDFYALVVIAFAVGGVANPLYSLLTAYTNDFLDHEDMASASGGMIMINGIGAMGAPIAVGYVMDNVGGAGFFLFISVALGLISVYAFYRMTQRPSTPVDETGRIVPMTPIATPYAADVAWEYAAQEAAEQADPDDGAAAEEPAKGATHV